MKTIGIIGTGHLGTHMLRLMTLNKLNLFLSVSDRDEAKAEKIANGSNVISVTNEENISCSDVLFITVKPDQVKSVCNDINKYSDHRDKKIIVSAAAGVPLNKLEKWTENRQDIIRCMPNILISRGLGTILWYSNKDHNKLLNMITEGPDSIWLDKEYLLDAGTVVSGCSPAFIAKMFETCIDIGIEMGFSESQSRQLVKNSLSGTSDFLKDTNGYQIIREVASKGGATEEGLKFLENKGFGHLLRDFSYTSFDRIKNITKFLD